MPRIDDFKAVAARDHRPPADETSLKVGDWLGMRPLASPKCALRYPSPDIPDLLLQLTGNRRLARQGLAVSGMLLCSLLMLASMKVADIRIAIFLITAGVFCATFGGVSGYTVAIEFGGQQTATVFSMMNMVGNFGAMLFPLVSGWLTARFNNWNLMILLFAGIMAVDAVCWALLNPRTQLFPDPPADS